MDIFPDHRAARGEVMAAVPTAAAATTCDTRGGRDAGRDPGRGHQAEDAVNPQALFIYPLKLRVICSLEDFCFCHM